MTTTELGKELRRIRINNDQKLVQMAEKLRYSPAFVSSLETGKKTPPNGFEEIVIKAYSLVSEDANKLRQTADLLRKNFTIEPKTGQAQIVTGLLKRYINGMSENDLEQIRIILLRHSRNT